MIVDLAVVFFLFLVCTLTKRRWIAEIAVILFFAPVKFFDDGLVFAFIWAACLALLCRAGLLALVAFEAARWIEWLPLTYHPSHWYFPQAMVGVVFCVVLALYGFYVSLGDKLALGGRGVLSFSDE